MSDVALARNIVAEIAGDCWGGKGDMLDRVYEEIEKYFRQAKQPHTWTRRRVRAFWHREAAAVRYHEMVELATVAAAVKVERDRLKEARKSHAEFIASAARMATALAVSDEEFHRQHIEALGAMALGSAHRQKRDVSGKSHGHFDPRHSEGRTLDAGDPR
ncbi:MULTISPECIES: hypothetical protein [unclassified Mesorhizobium]|uniref:hypothetical protein n=1 Tax=unclassified Mesorhizobium TaxID=325217 RepID=UPI001129A8D2|nr:MULTISPECIES: hypothetical protein [unclassified Mesorhizobium]TPK59063.1 hypothetical protein FJ551_25980 [Mesorhizobium sp. B2-5-1]TPL06656.1 hypothetical protein FJ944_22765 [Mesorhizobium sp. B2-4-11]